MNLQNFFKLTDYLTNEMIFKGDTVVLCLLLSVYFYEIVFYETEKH